MDDSGGFTARRQSEGLGRDPQVSRPLLTESSLQRRRKNFDINPGVDQLTDSINIIENKILRLEINMKNLISDVTRLVSRFEVVKKEEESLEERVEETKNSCAELHKAVALSRINVLTAEERLINLEKLSFDGTFVWKISNVREKFQSTRVLMANQKGENSSFYSPPFYTSRYGFKMCCRIYFNGEGDGRNTHLSLYFVILKGDYDAIIKWPFKQMVKFILIDQSENNSDIVDAFRPDPNSVSFRKPIGEMNIGSGLPKFCKISDLFGPNSNYVKDNTMFIKVIVDKNGLELMY